MMYQFNGRKMCEGNALFYSFLSKKDFQNTNLLFFPIKCKVAMAQRMNNSEWGLRSLVRSYPMLTFYFFPCSISRENSGSVKNRRRKAGIIYPSLIRENIFSSWTVVVRRHHVYVQEFHLPSCNSVPACQAT
jgi:hypothetical protein